jgi:diguanylate cyclase (GGDEF)-like protein
MHEGPKQKGSGAMLNHTTEIHADAARRERDRLAALDKFDVLDSPRERPFDRIASLIRNIFGVEVGIVSMIDGHRQWYKASDGATVDEVALEHTFCRLTVQGDDPVVVRDATQDARFSANPHVTGKPHVRFYAGVPLRTRQGHNIGTLCAIDSTPREFSDRDLLILNGLADIAMDELELRQQASFDSLTGTLCRRAFRQEGDRAASLARRHGHALSTIVFDLDYFKSINDRYGHAAGDEVLVSVANLCRQVLRKGDSLGRLGGEEFGIFLPHTDSSGALRVADKIRQEIAALRTNFAPEKTVTASLGIASMLPASEGIDRMLQDADDALYKAKSNGRNACVVSEVETPRAPRRRVLKAGRIIFNDRKSVMDCTVRSFSSEGAGIDILNTRGIPDRFQLSIRSDGFESACRVVSQTDRHIEVEFC